MNVKRYLAAAMSAIMLLSCAAAYAEEADVVVDDDESYITAGSEEQGNEQDDIADVSIAQQVVSNFTMPRNQRATIITPTVDYLTGEGYTIETAEAELDQLFTSLTEIGLNTVYINTVYEDTPYFSTDMNMTDEKDYSALALEKAYQHNLRVYMVLDLNYLLSHCEEGIDPLDSLISKTHRFVLKYRCDGILIDNYYSAKTQDSYTNYMQNGSGIGYDNWLYDTNKLYFSAVSDVVHITDNSIPVGILINDMWANASSNEEGSSTEDPVQALYDGFSDTRDYIASGYADFCLVKAYGSLTSSTLPFEEVTGWWGGLSDNYGITMYIVHFNERQGSGVEGWGSVDQILQQLTVAKEIPAFGGSVFHSCNNLLTNTTLTPYITKFYGDEINENSLFEELTMVSPSQLSFVTYEQYVDFMGTFDENFDVYFNGQKVTLNSAGNFYFEEALNVGQNTFTIEHKSKTYTYRIERKVITIRSLDSSIESGKTLSVTGETKLEIACTAYRGATVTATLNGKTISLKESESRQDDDVNSSYARFVGTYTVPAGIIEQEQNLGTITVTSSYAGYTQTLYGASVKVIALPKPVVDITASIMEDQNAAGSGEVVGTIDPVRTEDETVQYVRVTNDYTIVYNGATAGPIQTPDFAQLPAGTLDYLLASSGDYYITESGKRFKKTETTVFTETGLGDNPLVVKSTGSSGGDSYFKIGLKYRTSYNIAFAGNNYFSGGDGEFNLYDFTATHVYITFDNVTSVTKLPNFEYNYVFSAGKWETVTIDGIPKFRLVLTLRQPGVYAGCGATYNSDGDLVLSFGITTNRLDGMTIVIDPGHGYGKSESTLDPGAVGFITEFEANLGIAKELEKQLTALGAKVVRIKSESQFVLTAQRPSYGRAYGCDLYISIHANKMEGMPNIRGTEVYYFTPYSQPLAAAISSQVSGYFTGSVYSDGADKNRGAKYSYYWVTLQQDFPSVLVETGFVSNEEEALALANPTHQKNIATRIIKGIQTYISRSSISYASNGTDTADITGNIEDTTTEPEDIESTDTESTDNEYTGTEPSDSETVDTGAAEETTDLTEETEETAEAVETEVTVETEETEPTEYEPSATLEEWE